MNRHFAPALWLGVLTFFSPLRSGAEEPEHEGKTLGVWWRELGSSDPDVRASAASALGQLGKAADKAVPRLLAAVRQDKSAAVRLAAVLAVGPIASGGLKGHDDLLPTLCEALAKDADPSVRRGAATSLGHLGSAAEPAFADLLKCVLDRKEDCEVRAQAAGALSRIGKVAAARDAVPKLVDVPKNAKENAKVRERVLWALAVHKKDLAECANVLDALEVILPEPKTKENRMLRYNAAYFLGMLKRDKVSEKTLDVLLEFLKDDTVELYLTPRHQERGSKLEFDKVGSRDGRVMVIQALKSIGYKRLVVPRPDIMNQLSHLRDDDNLDPDMRHLVRELFDDLTR
jgi:HEAT repeat protein